MKHKFLALPIRPALAGVSWASLSVQIIPTEEQKQARRLEAEQLTLFDLKPERRAPLHPLGSRRFPVERLYFWFGSASKKRAYSLRVAAANTDGFKSNPAAPSSVAASA